MTNIKNIEIDSDLEKKIKCVLSKYGIDFEDYKKNLYIILNKKEYKNHFRLNKIYKKYSNKLINGMIEYKIIEDIIEDLSKDKGLEKIRKSFFKLKIEILKIFKINNK